MTLLQNSKTGRRVFNVKGYGALGNTSHDDTGNFQDAINAAMLAGGGDVYAPPLEYPNYYKTTAPLVFTNALSDPTFRMVRLIGEKNLANAGSAIQGNFSGYLIDNPATGGSSNLAGVRGLRLSNPHAAGGCIRFGGQTTGVIEDCSITAGFRGLYLATDSYNIHVRNCDIRGNANVGIGVLATQTTLEACSIVGWAEGVRAYNAGFVAIGNRFEVNLIGLMIGKDSAGSSETMQGCAVLGNSFERNDTGLYVNAAAGGLIGGNMITGIENVAGGGDIPYGIYLNSADGTAFVGNTISIDAATAAIDISAASVSKISFVSCIASKGAGAGVAWNMPTASHAEFSFVGCNNPAHEMTVAQLPASPIPGMMFNVSDATATTVGATVAGTGANHVTVVRSNSVWRIM